MAPSTPSPPPVLVPSWEQAALAIVIIQSKPSKIPVREYVLQLRAQVRRGQNPADADEPDHYLDLVAYWQEQCRRAQDDCDQLRSINIKLERSNELLSSQASADTPDINVAPRASKRKAPAVPPARPQKRPKPPRSKTPQQLGAEAQDTIENDKDFLDGLGKDGKSLTEALFITHNLCRVAKPDAEPLCLSLVRTSSVLGKVICLVASNHEQLTRQGRTTPGTASLDQDRTDFSIALSICARAFMSILVGTGKLAGCGTDQRLPSLVICELANTFKSGLTSIETSARESSRQIVSQPVQPKKGKGKAPVTVAHESVPARAVAHLLSSFLGFLERTDSTHQKIFDGFIFMLFERIGKRLYYCTFGRHRSTTVEGNIVSIPEPHNAADTSKREREALAIRLELKALVLILERAMGLAPHHMNLQTGRETKNVNHPNCTLSLKNPPNASRSRLSPIAKDRLQRTLVCCMYGTNGDDEFLDVLTKPTPAFRLASLPRVAKVDDKDVEDWYKHEVWRLIGWDVLAKEGSW